MSGAPALVVLLAAAAAVVLLVRPTAAVGSPARAATVVPPDTAAGVKPRGPGTGAGSRVRLVAAGGAGLAALVVVPVPWAVPAAAVAGLVTWRHSRTWEDRAVRRRREQLDADVVHVVDLLAAAVGAGASPAFALHEVTLLVEGATAETLAPWSRRLRWGSEPVAVWTDMASHPQLGRLGQVLLRSATSGAPVAAALERLAEDERARRRGGTEARVRQVEVKASAPLGLCLLPAFVLLGIVPLVAGAVSGLVLGG